MHDAVEAIGKGTMVQHGKHNDRIYLLKLNDNDALKDILANITRISIENRYSKIFCKIPKRVAPEFFARGFVLEAFIPKFYGTSEDVFFVSKFLNSDRLLNIETDQLKALSGLLKDEATDKQTAKAVKSEYTIRKLDNGDIKQITDIYKVVFETYPFPIHDPAYIQKTMREDVQYFGAEKNGKLAALASSEIDSKGKNAEMTDFATLSEHAGNKLSLLLLKAMESDMQKQGILTLYTIARLNSVAMNKTFLRQAYQYSGTLIKNTNISGKIESMNVYYKHLQALSQ